MRLDVDRSVQAVRAGWPQVGPAIELPADVTEPDVDQADVDAAMESFGTPATAGPVVVTVGTAQVPLAPEQLTPALSVTAQDGELVPAVDGAVLKAALLAVAPALETATTDAKVVLSEGAPVVVPAVAGRHGRPGGPGHRGAGRVRHAGAGGNGRRRRARAGGHHRGGDRAGHQGGGLRVRDEPHRQRRSHREHHDRGAHR